ncbi:hypothetical protein IQ07DRAFT_606535 [Pyrenochaeta sp. DS3sAY3a]|nr:hypothetical protein IQ07DRAFT_606535 [Pyrenochaeta sp. DS3sAY3a]
MASQRETFNTAAQYLPASPSLLQWSGCLQIDIREIRICLPSGERQVEDVHQGMQECMQSSEDRNREYESKIKELERENQEAKEKLSAAFARFRELEGKIVSCSAISDNFKAPKVCRHGQSGGST